MAGAAAAGGNRSTGVRGQHRPRPFRTWGLASVHARPRAAGHAARPGGCRADVADPAPGLHRPGPGHRGLRLRAWMRRTATRSPALSNTIGGARRAGGAEPDPHPPRRAAPGLQRLARSHGDRRHRQPVRPDPVGSEGAAADGAPDRTAAIAGAARRARRPELLLLAQAPGATLRQPHRLARQRLRRLRVRTGPALRDAGARAGAGDRRGRLRPDRGLRTEVVGARDLHRRAGTSRRAGQLGRSHPAGREGNRSAAAAALHAAAAFAAQATAAWSSSCATFSARCGARR